MQSKKPTVLPFFLLTHESRPPPFHEPYNHYYISHADINHGRIPSYVITKSVDKSSIPNIDFLKLNGYPPNGIEDITQEMLVKRHSEYRNG